MANGAMQGPGGGQEDDGRETGASDQPDETTPDPWMAEMTRKGVQAIRTLKDAGLWEAFGAAMGDHSTPADEAAFFRDHGLPDPGFPDATAPAPCAGPRSTQRGRAAPDAVWARAREDYLAGEAAETVCARHGLGVSTLRARASAEGWRRADQPDPEPVDLDAEYEDGPPSFDAMLRHAEVRLNRAVLRGRPAEASSWLRVHARVKALAALEAARRRHEAIQAGKAAAQAAQGAGPRSDG